MRVHRLALTAFGPFPDLVEVDLDQVGGDGLFLLWGPTGSGKTTLLDAVVFALYGTVPGARGEEKRLRSDHAADTVRTEVQCEVTLGGERLLVTRRPEQQRPKKRGAGSTTEQARLVVQRWSADGWQPVSTRIDEGSEHLRMRLGLSAEQFCQVVLLPQGDFARFLRAEPDDRARLLRTLFDVERFARAEQWLADQRRTADDQLRRLSSDLGALVARVAQTAEVSVPEELAPELLGLPSGGRLGSWLTGLRADARSCLHTAGRQAAAAAERVAAQDVALAAARELDQRHTRRVRAECDLAAVHAAAVGVAAVRAELDAGRRAEVVRDVLEAAGRAALDDEQAGAALGTAQRRWAEVSDGRAPTALWARELRDEVAGLRALVPEVERAAQLARRARRLERSVQELQRRCARLADTVSAFPEQVQRHEADVRAAEAAAARLPGLTAARVARSATVRAAEDVQGLTDDVQASRRALDAARESWLDAREQRVELGGRRLAGMAAELAGRLEAGEECAVCGSVQHPRPATAHGPVVTEATEQAAAARVDQAEAVLGAARAEWVKLTEQLAARQAQAGELRWVELLQRLSDEQQAERCAAALAGSLAGARAALSALVAAREQASTERAAAHAELAGHRVEHEASVQTVREVTGRLAAARGDHADLGARMAHLSEVAARCDALLAAQAEQLRARQAATRAGEAARRRAVEVGFPDVLDAAAAAVPPARLARLSRQVEEHDRARDVATAALTDPELADLPARPDVAALLSGSAAGTAAREAAVAALEHARRRCVGLDLLAGDLTALEVELDERRVLAQRVIELADLVQGRGSNALRMRLESFVLAARLEQVAQVASRRLQDMSAGRYTFLHSDAQARHGARGGLGLDVFDEHTGLRRPTKTLSGGEGFMASLALALGLADVVTAESGGVQIDTLFVDEGFGSLDPQALDAVMTVLDELRRGGRTVGVVSHVEELRIRIPSRVEIVTGRHGSRVAG